jgi:hypothetical protein
VPLRSAVAAQNLHHPVFAGELHLLEALALHFLLDVQEPLVVQLRELLLELQMLVVQALQLRVSIDKREDELLVRGLHGETPFDGVEPKVDDAEPKVDDNEVSTEEM